MRKRVVLISIVLALCLLPMTAFADDYKLTGNFGQLITYSYDGNTEIPQADIERIYGSTRYETAIEVAEKYKDTAGKFNNVVVAYGQNFPDALAGGYLAKVKDAPILLVDPSAEDEIADYINNNIESGGTVYILGGTGVVSSSFENKIKGTTERLGGKDRYETNLKILKASGVTDQDILVCTGKDYPDSLSASAAGLPILLVDNSLKEEQKTYLNSLSTSKFYLIGGEGAVKPSIEADLKNLGYSNIERLAGSTRYETSTAVASKFFPATRTVMLAYAKNFPDGLSGGPLAMLRKAPIILTDSCTTDAAKEYVKVSGATKSITLGGPALISDSAVKTIMEDTEFDYFAIGNSITRHGVCEYWWNDTGGMAASTVEKDYVHRVTAYLEEKYGEVHAFAYNFSRWEKTTERAETLNYLDPYLYPELDLVTLQLSENATNMETFEEDFSELVNYIREKAPEAQVIIIDDFWAAGDKADIKKRIADINGLAFADLSSIKGNADYQCGLGTVVYDPEGGSHIVEHKGVAGHPGDLGMEYIANAVIALLE